MRRRVLVIRLGALGDLILSFPAFAAIRAHEADARITLLTTAPYAALGRAAPWFDHVEVDAKPQPWDIAGVFRLARQMAGYDMVYDLQTSRRSGRYRWLAQRARWSGIARGASDPHDNPERDRMHTRERQQEQLAMAHVAWAPVPSLDWLMADAAPPAVARPYALLVPGAAAHRPEKRWPVAHYSALAAMLRARGLTPVVLGTALESPMAAAIPDCLDLTGRTTIADIAALARDAVLAVGNDTGPMHLIAAMGCRCIVLFSGASDPALTAPRGPDGAWPMVIRVPDLAQLGVERVAAAVLELAPVA